MSLLRGTGPSLHPIRFYESVTLCVIISENCALCVLNYDLWLTGVELKLSLRWCVRLGLLIIEAKLRFRRIRVKSRVDILTQFPTN